MAPPRTFAILAIALGLACCHGPNVKELLQNQDRPRPKASGGGSWDKTRLVILDYTFRGESVIYDLLENKETAPSHIIEAKYTWETLHHDADATIFSRLKFVRCVSGPCGDDIPDVYVHFQQGGNNLIGIYMDLRDKPEGYQPQWNFLLSVANIVWTPAIGGEGDSQFVDSPYGHCQYDFSRPQDKHFKRNIGGCELTGDFNYTRADGLQTTKYTQEVLYVQNVKTDADIVIIEAVEELKMRSMINPKWGMTIESRVNIEMENRTRMYVLRHCDMDSLADDCARNVFNLTKISDKKYEGILLAPRRPNRFGVAVAEYRNHLYEMGPSHTCEEHARLYSEILREALAANAHDFAEAIRHPENEPVLKAIANALGSVGDSESMKVYREVLFTDAPETLEDYLFGAAVAVSNDEKWHKNLMYWLVEAKAASDPSVYHSLSNALATVLWRRCESTTIKQKACARSQDKVITKFVSVLTECTNNDCIENALLAFINLPVPEALTYARQYICRGRAENIEHAALGVIQNTDVKFYDSQLIRALVSVFRNTCPTETSLQSSQLAVDALLDSVLDHPNAATLLLRGENDQFRDEERWNYFYKAVTASRHQDENKDEVWRRMRAFKVFRPNWNQRALRARSNRFYGAMKEVVDHQLELDMNSNYFEEYLQGIRVALSFRKKKHVQPFFEFNLNGYNHDSFFRGASAAAVLSSTPEIYGRIGILGHQLPRQTIVDGDGDLVALGWGGDGHTVHIFEGNAPLRAYQSALPLLSGLTTRISSQGSINLKTLGGLDVSIWNREAMLVTTMNISASLDLEASLLSNLEPAETVASKFSIVTSITVETEIDFASLPPRSCGQSSSSYTPISLSTTTTDHATGKNRTWKQPRRLFPTTYRLAADNTKQCNLHHNRIAGDSAANVHPEL
ncbi:unnamed protein product, partial [Mesorhabditis spiculigera]